MFMDDDSAFDVPADNNQRTSKYLTGETTRPTTAGTGISRMTLRDIDDDDDNVRGPDSGTAMSNRARMLEKQREIQLSKRQSLAGGQQMMRKSNDGPVAPNSPVRNSDSQTTPAIRHFSQPKAAANEENDRASSEFGRNSRNGPPSAQKPARSNRYSDEDEDVRPSRNSQQTDSRSGSRGQRRSDDDDDDYRGNRRSNRGDSRERRNNDRNDRDYDRPPRDNRRDNRDDSRDRRGSNDNYNSRDNSSRRRDDSRDRYDNGRGSRNDEDWSRNNKGGRGDDRDDRNYSNSRKSRRDDDDDSRDGGDRNRRGGGGDRSPPRSQERRNNSNGRDWEAAGRADDRRRGGGNDSDRDRDRDRDNRNDRNDRGGKSKQRDDDENNNEGVPKEVFVPPDYSNMRRFLTSPLPKNNGILQCYIRRNKSGTNKLYPIYSLYLKEGDVFLMASRKRPKNKTSNYLISMDQNDLNRSGNSYLGKLRSNFVGTEFQIFDNGVNPKDTDDEVVRADASVRTELGSVMYAANVMGSRGPRKMQVALPGLDENGQITKWKDGSGPSTAKGEPTGSDNDILSHMKDRNFKDLVYLINKPPRWNEQVGAYVLNFNGRVTMASVKNFQLVDPDEQNAVVLQFGRVGKDEFTMDFQWPISPYQAFAVTLSSFDSKIACD